MNKQRLQELAGIKELSVNKPMSKTEIIEEIGESDPGLLWNLVTNKNIKSFLTSFGGYETLRDVLTDEWGYDEEPIIEKTTNLIEKYYQYISPEEISIINNDNIKNDIQGFKNLWIYSDDNDITTFVTKF